MNKDIKFEVIQSSSKDLAVPADDTEEIEMYP